MGKLKFIIAALVICFSCNSIASTSPSHGGVFLLGGSGFPSEVIPWIKEHSFGQGPFLVITAYNINLEKWTERMQGHPFEYILLGVDNNLEENLSKILNASAIFFDGGDQADYVRLLKDTQLSLLIQQRFDRGLPIGGVSAGMAIMSEFFYGAQDGGVHPDQAEERAHLLDIQRHFFKIPQLIGTIFDTHYSERNREKRLQVFLKEIEKRNNTKVEGVGVDEGTAIVFDKDGNHKVFGKGKVHRI